jgi:hypothetical protein
MSRTTLKVVGTLRISENDGLQYSVSFPNKDGGQATYWVEALPTVREWPSVGKHPESQKRQPLHTQQRPSEANYGPRTEQRRRSGDAPVKFIGERFT